MSHQAPATSTVTIVVGRTAKPEAPSPRIRRWLEKLIDRGSRAPGFVRGDIQAAEPERLDDWIVVYEFATRETLDGWLRSPQRMALVARESDFFVGDARQQVLATPSPSTSVTAVASFSVRPGLEAQFAEHYQRLLDIVAPFEGFIRCELLPARPGVQPETHIVFSFASRKTLDRWFESAERRKILADFDALLDGPSTRNVVAGFGGWFEPPVRAPKTWKQAFLVLLALYPTSLLLGWLRGTILPGLPFAPAVLVVNIAGVAVLSWILLPPLTERYKRWLRR